MRVAPWEGGPLTMARRVECYLLWLCAFALQGGGIFLTVSLGSSLDPTSNPNPNPNPNPNRNPNPKPKP